jgi:hypothetical protein
MKKLVAVAVASMALVAAAPAGAQGGGNGNGNNGCGDLFSDLAAPGFGESVSDVAREGGVNELFRAICGKD